MAHDFAKLANKRTHANFLYMFEQGQGVKRQFIHHAGDVHQIVVPAHRIPIIGKNMVILVALMLFFQNVIFLQPTLAGHQVAPLMDILFVERLAGNPCVMLCFDDDVPVSVHFFPAFLARDDVEGLGMSSLSAVRILQVIHPPKALLPPLPAFFIRGTRIEFEEGMGFFPDRGKRPFFKDDHKLPPLVAQRLKDGAIRV